MGSGHEDDAAVRLWGSGQQDDGTVRLWGLVIPMLTGSADTSE